MPKTGLLQRWILNSGMCLLTAWTACGVTCAQDLGGPYAHHADVTAFVEYSNDSSHMLIGYATGRQIAAVGAGYEHRDFLTNEVAGSWVAEMRPLMRVIDPTMKGFTLAFPEQPAYSGVVNFTSAVPVDNRVSATPLHVILMANDRAYAGTATYIGGTRTTYVSAFSPVGYKLSLLPHKRYQPFVTGLSGFVVAPRDIPVFNSASFNFTFEVGAGVEIFQTHTRSCRLEYRYHHISNAGTGQVNPGIDSGVVKVSYSFGR